jgi:carbonic anhydrase/acetyltransferase-like protein (isoleucine patch superfamily)
MSIIEFEDKKPVIHPSVFLAPGSWVIGEVTLEEEVNVWNNAIIRGDDDKVKIKARTTILEGCLIEAPTGNPVHIGKDVIISHGATVHRATIGDGSIIGIGAIVLDRVIIVKVQSLAQGL